MYTNDNVLTQLLNEYRQASEGLDSLNVACDYPYAKGAMTCVNRSTDTWEITATWKRKIEQKERRIIGISNRIQKRCITLVGSDEGEVSSLLDFHGSFYDAHFEPF